MSDARGDKPIDPFPRKGRDLRLDFFRGLSLFFIFIDHIPNNFLGYFTLRSIAFSDAAEVFIFISGYTAALVYGRSMSQRGALFATAQIYRRVWQLYVAHIFLFVIFTAEVSYTVLAVNNPMYNEEMGVGDFLSEPHVAIIKALLLQFQPTFLDILPLYIVLLGDLPAGAHRAGARAAMGAAALGGALRADLAPRLVAARLSRRPCLVLQSARLAVPVHHRRQRRPCARQRPLAVPARAVAVATRRDHRRHTRGHQRHLGDPLGL